MSLSELTATIRADRAANRGYPKSVLVLFAFRITHALRGRHGFVARLAYGIAASLYRLVAEWLLGIELPSSTVVGAGLRLRHGVGLVVNPAARIGRGVLLRHNVTIGNRNEGTDCPVVGDDVEVGTGAVLLGSIVIGDRARIGAGAIVLHDVPADGVVVCAAATLLPRKDVLT